MALTPETRASQSAVVAVVEADAPETRVSQSTVRAITQIPTEELKVSQADVRVVGFEDSDARVSQSLVRAIVRGRSEDPRVRVWTFTLDGHDYYVLRLGTQETLVYDTLSEQWYVWGSGEGDLWRAYNGTNWIGGDRLAFDYGSNVIVGDDGNGSLYFLDPDLDVDDDAVSGDERSRPYKRVVQGQMTTKGYGSRRVFDVSLEGSVGTLTDPTLNSINLSFSDDRGNTYTDAGDIIVEDGVYDTRLNWRSLGSLNMPGRLVKVTDTGALRRIDFLDSSVEE